MVSNAKYEPGCVQVPGDVELGMMKLGLVSIVGDASLGIELVVAGYRTIELGAIEVWTDTWYRSVG